MTLSTLQCDVQAKAAAKVWAKITVRAMAAKDGWAMVSVAVTNAVAMTVATCPNSHAHVTSQFSIALFDPGENKLHGYIYR